MPIGFLRHSLQTIWLCTLLTSCAGYADYTRLSPGPAAKAARTHQEKPGSSPALAAHRTETRSVDHPRWHAELHFVGWHYFPTEREQLQASLAEAGILSRHGAAVMIEVLLEQSEITHPLQKLANAVLTLASLSAIPLYERYAYRLRFRVTDRRSQLHEIEYVTLNRVFTRLLALPLMPFYCLSTAPRSSTTATSHALVIIQNTTMEPTQDCITI